MLKYLVCLTLPLLLASAKTLSKTNAANFSSSSFEYQQIDSYELVYNPCNSIRQAGFICVDCATLGYCINMNNQWQTMEMTTCRTDAGFYCSDEEFFGCQWGLQCNVPVRGQFYCQKPGIYPDPYDCRNYHECNSLNQDTPHRCGNGFAYSTVTQSCSMPRQSQVCQEKQYECTAVGDIGAWKSNPSFYYICQKEQQGDMEIFYPLLMQCQLNYVFNGRSCVPASQQQRSHALELESEVEASSLPMDMRASCRNFELASDSTNCSNYLVCVQNEWVTYQCPVGSHFDDRLLLCRVGSCTTNTNTNTNTSNSNITASTKCKRIGMSADLSDCQKFYHCASLNDNLRHTTCPAGTIFNTDMYSCVPGTC